MRNTNREREKKILGERERGKREENMKERKEERERDRKKQSVATSNQKSSRKQCISPQRLQGDETTH